ncbi:MAG: hypothetical protein IJ491_07455 [Clostridia bacterium]|nr:hypothetical protein [Clostridia bacterium]
MISFVENTNLPCGKVKALICAGNDNEILDFFESHGIEAFKVSSNENIDSSVSSHADMSALHLGRERIIVDKMQVILKHKLEEIGMTVFETSEKISGCYPHDIKLNFTLLGRRAFGKFGYADKVLCELLSGKEIISVRQGYCKCSVLVVRENAVITDDVAIHHKMLENDVDSLLINKGDISLPGHEYGFIGGASGKISENEVVFFGNIRNHRDFEKINSFLAKHGCDFVCTDDGCLRDIGGIIPIVEEKLRN